MSYLRVQNHSQPRPLDPLCHRPTSQNLIFKTSLESSPQGRAVGSQSNHAMLQAQMSCRFCKGQHKESLQYLSIVHHAIVAAATDWAHQRLRNLIHQFLTATLSTEVGPATTLTHVQSPGKLCERASERAVLVLRAQVGGRALQQTPCTPPASDPAPEGFVGWQ